MQELIEKINERKIKLWIGLDGELHYRAPKGALSSGLAGEIRQNKVKIVENQRIIAGNAQFTGIAAGRGVGFTTGLLLLREGLGMRETPIRPHSWH